MIDDNGGQAAFEAALSGGEMPAVDTGAGGGEMPAGGASQSQETAPAGGGEPQPQPQRQEPAQEPGQGATPQPGGQQPGQGEAMVPSWRLREITEAREAERQRVAEVQRQYEDTQRRLAQYEAYYQRQQEEAERAKRGEALTDDDFFQAPGAHIDKRLAHQLDRVLGPLQERFRTYDQRFEQVQAEANRRVADVSRNFAVQRHGGEAVNAAYQRIAQALQAKDPEVMAFDRDFYRYPDPFEALIQLDRRRETLRETGGDLNAYRQRYADEMLRDPQFLQRALEAHRQSAVPVQNGAVPGRQPAPTDGMPSLNRTSGSAGGAVEVDDPQAVFSEALNAPRPRPR